MPVLRAFCSANCSPCHHWRMVRTSVAARQRDRACTGLRTVDDSGLVRGDAVELHIGCWPLYPLRVRYLNFSQSLFKREPLATLRLALGTECEIEHFLVKAIDPERDIQYSLVIQLPRKSMAGLPQLNGPAASCDTVRAFSLSLHVPCTILSRMSCVCLVLLIRSWRGVRHDGWIRSLVSSAQRSSRSCIGRVASNFLRMGSSGSFSSVKA